jgi:Rieske Fe-S protein
MAFLEDEPEPEGMSRRTFVKGVMLAGAGLLTGSLVASGTSLFPPPIQLKGELKETFVYAAGKPGPGETIWWNDLGGQELRAEHLPLFRGAATVWRGLFDEENQLVLGSGLAALVIHLPADRFRAPEEFADHFVDLGDGSVLVALYDRCVHLCCVPGWHLKPVPEAFKDYGTNPKTLLYGEDPIWCQCHNSQYDPMSLQWERHPNGQRYVGARFVHGPATRGLPAIPIRLQADGQTVLGDASTVVDGTNVMAWYTAYCR